MAGKLKAFGFDSELLRSNKPQKIVIQNWCAAIGDLEAAQRAIESALHSTIELRVHGGLATVLQGIMHTLVSVQESEIPYVVKYKLTFNSEAAISLNHQDFTRESLAWLTIQQVVTQEAAALPVMRILLALLAAPYVYPNRPGLMDTLAGMNLYPTPAALYCFCMMNRIPMNIN